jgi:hypothetical protein
LLSGNCISALKTIEFAIQYPFIICNSEDAPKSSSLNENPHKINSCNVQIESLCRDVHTGTSQFIHQNASVQTRFPARLKTSDRFLMIYQPINIALQNPRSSHNHLCVQRPESFGLHDSITILLPRSRRNQTNQPIKKSEQKTLEPGSPLESARPALEDSR